MTFIESRNSVWSTRDYVLPELRKGMVRRARLQPCRTEPQPLRALAPEVRVSMLWPEQNRPCKNRTSAAKAAHVQEVYGTAQAVPFVHGCLIRTTLILSHPWQDWPRFVWTTHAAGGYA